MPSSARKSSVGAARRGIQKAHIPYRGDNPEVGKKTGIAVAHVERMSDGFEPFEEVLQQADKRTPPKPKGRKKSAPVARLPDFDDEDGEMSMDIDDSASPRRKSFAQIDQDVDGQEDEQEEEQEDDEQEVDEPEDEPPESPPRIDKGKRKARLDDIQEEDEAIEDEIAQGLNDIGQYDSEQEEREPTPPPKKKQKRDEQERQRNTSSKSKKENRAVSESREGVRRSKRERFKPLEWWRGEKVVYGRTRSSGPIFVPTIKEIRRIPTDAPQPLGGKKRGFNRGRSKTVDDKAATATYNPEEGWDDSTEPFGEVYDMDKQALVVRRLVWTAQRVKLTKAGSSDWLFEKVFGDSDFVAAGQLVIPPECRKPTKATKDNTYIFYVIEGAVNFKVHEVSKIVATGGMFIAPRGNTYFIENISTREAKLFFTQARKVPKGDNETSGSVAPTPRKERKRSLEEVRSSSPGRALAGRAAQSLPPAPLSKQTKAGKRAPSARV
ncbi:hypothetical protein P691DRAFT_802498 [Macrolepiota fuliginosa MF-IS2]|uniref:CENP-C homolog n=1 Tax=Macrolepiota fuliginosa MF-IS2 TaxID=1400762 RepID=A0A9P6C3M2_9AGAR|nr:hypothetical protein P691DRAFT_802498 [Macrolepiota fuliginosa MF-IS2]